MTSQGSGLDIIEKVAEWSAEELQDNLDHIIPELSYLSGEEKGHVLQALHALLVTCLPCVPIEKADDSVLRHAMPATQQLLHESLEGIQLRLGDISLSQAEEMTDTLSSLLQVCIELLKCAESVLHYIASNGNVPVEDVPSVFVIVASLILQTFKHCKDSESLYGNEFATVVDVLSTLFRQCHQVQCHFFVVLSSHVQFNCTLEYDLSYLVDILQVLSQVGEQVLNLDLKTMAEHWKGFARLVQQHLEHLRQRLDVAYPVGYLCLEVQHSLEQFTSFSSVPDAKALARLLKANSFILKIVVKLCEQFGGGSGCLGNCHSELFTLLLSLFRCSTPCLQFMKMAENLMDEIERHIIVAADPLISHLINEVEFRQIFFKKFRDVIKESKDRLPFMLMVISVMRRLLSCDIELRELWLEKEKEKNIFGSLLTLLEHCHVELSSAVSVPAVVRSGDPPRNCDLYETLTSYSAGLLLTASTSQFQNSEMLLLDAMLESHIWPAMLALDVWCVCARAGNPELSLDHVFYLVDVVTALEAAGLKGRPEYKNTTLFIRRMCSFLGSKGKQALLDKFPPTEFPHMWEIFDPSCLPNNIQESVCDALFKSSVKNVEDFLNSKCLKSYNQMFLSLCGLSAALNTCPSKPSLSNNVYSTLASTLVSLWHYISRVELASLLSASEMRICGQDWFISLLEIICVCMQHLVLGMNNSQILQVLSPLQKMIQHAPSAVKFSVCKVLRGLGAKFLDPSPDQQKVCSVIANLFAMLLQDSNPVVEEFSLTTFEFFAHITRHENIVANTVSGNKALQDTITQFLQREAPPSSSNGLSVEDYLESQAKIAFSHKCKEGKVRPVAPSTPEKPVKKFRLELDSSNDLSAFLGDDLLSEIDEKEVTDTVNRICKDTLFVVSFCALNKLPDGLKADLKKAVVDLNDIVELRK